MRLKIPQATKEGFAEVELYGAFDMDYPTSLTRRGRVQGEGGVISPTLCANNNGISVFANMAETRKRPEGKGWCFDSEKGKWFRVRKLTPRECFRLMDVKETDIDKLMSTHINKKGKEEQVVSNSALYKCAGNSIVVNCMYHLFKQIYFPADPVPGEGQQLTLF